MSPERRHDAQEHAHLGRLERAAKRTGRRLKLRRALTAASLGLPLPLGYAAVVVGAAKALPLSLEQVQPWLWGGLVPVAIVIAAALRAAFARRTPFEGALALDRHHGLEDRITNALAFARLPAGDRSPLMDAAIADAAEHAPKLEPRRAARIVLPRELGYSAALLLGLVGLQALEVQQLREVPPAVVKVQPMLLTPDDVELFREIGQELAKGSDDPQLSAAARRFNQLVEDIAAHRMDRREVFERLGQLERELAESSELDRESLDEGLKGLARELEKSGLTKPAAQALAEKRLADAEQALRELAERLKKKQNPPSKAELDKLRSALQKASSQTSEHQAGIEQRRKELEEEQQSLLKKKQQGDKSAKTEQKAAENKRKLERLDREKQRADKAKQKLSELDKQLQEAARQLMQDMQAAGQSLESAAEDVNRMSKQQQTDEQKKEMLKRLQELREVLRQQGKGGKEQMDRMQRFGERARGGGGKQPGQTGKPGSGSEPGQLRLSRGQGDGPGIDVPMPGSSPGAPGAGESEGQEGGGDPGKGYGSGHNPNLAGDPTELEGKTQDVSAAGVDSGQGAASAEVIYGAAERGFVGRGYQKVFTDYETVAEQVMAQDEIPPGYRFYVRRYFQLIRPRD
ncbi:MAG TPA: hypothetical protein VEX18_18355 [Polyangiaceae bacterium]|nr:hypothetical protein [Polyangiaceae bacterium]